MSIVKALFGNTKKYIENIFFGEIQIRKLKNGNFLFISKRHFSPIKKKIEISIEGNEFDKLDFANSFFEKIEFSYQEITYAVTPIIEDTLKNWKEDFKIINFYKEFRPIYLHLPINESTQSNWEIVFETIHDPNHQFTIIMSDMEAKEINIDG
ncbi:hypothetical protein ACE193_22615 [Bernardetia sp. OM2101]|uniref:hypothetical protein n=1 Tax=Bernardetia sp. OM2101 TaxID=3344876 RepID=UPI0035D11E97